MPRKRTSNELRCFCARKPLLATYGINSKGKAYIHIKVYKQSRIFGEAIVLSGEILLHCRECFRWHKVIMKAQGVISLAEETEPPAVSAEA